MLSFHTTFTDMHGYFQTSTANNNLNGFEANFYKQKKKKKSWYYLLKQQIMQNYFINVGKPRLVNHHSNLCFTISSITLQPKSHRENIEALNH